jgi:GNAT superfamily N-acetyltransferase
MVEGIPEMGNIRIATLEDEALVIAILDTGNIVQSASTIWWRFTASNARLQRREFIALYDDVAMAHWLVRKDRMKVLNEIAILPEHRRQGIGIQLIEYIGLPIKAKTDADNVVSNNFYLKHKFKLVNIELTKSKRKPMNVYEKYYA